MSDDTTSGTGVEREREREVCPECGGVHTSEPPLLYRIRKYLAKLLDPGPIDRAVRRELTKEEVITFYNVIGHQECMPTHDEIVYTNPSVDEKDLRSRLARLRAMGLLRYLTAEPPDGEEYQLYAATEKGIDAMIESGLDIEGLRSDYARLERTPEIREREAIPRPPKREYRGLYVPVDGDPEEES